MFAVQQAALSLELAYRERISHIVDVLAKTLTELQAVIMALECADILGRK